MKPSQRSMVVASLLLALAITPALSGCSMVEGIIERQTGGDVDLGGQGLPDGFPSADVPLIDGEVIFGAGIDGADGQVWNVTVRVADVTAFDTISAQLQDAGFTIMDTGVIAPTEESATAVFDSDRYGVLVVVTTDGGGGFAANYSVTAKS